MPKLGSKLSEGSQHEIYEDSDNNAQVIKIPKRGNRFSFELVMRDIELMEKYFPKWTLPTDLVRGVGGYSIYQRRVDPVQHLRPSHMVDSSLKNAFGALLDANDKMRNDEKVELDLLGTSGTWRALKIALEGEGELELFNVLVETREGVRSLFLNGLLFHFGETSFRERMNASISSGLHRRILRAHFGVPSSYV